MPIQILPAEVASQIAAGEVIERPASVVKELVENALDAGARYIKVTVEGAGKRLIEVADDGRGIPEAEVPVAVARHATSKLQRAEDLFHITTLGFRGEALASIGSVSRLTLTSRTAETPGGVRLRVEGGLTSVLEPVGASPGTVVRVENLFYNVPARLKFLKSDATERSQIDGLVTRYALAYPAVRFHLAQENKVTLQTSGNGDRREALSALYGVEIARQMLEVLAEMDGLKVTGFISPLTLTRSNRREITFFVNGRPVQDVTLVTALVQAYQNLIMVGRYPMAVIFLDLDPGDVDVNVHPTKAEVRFRERDQVFSAVQRAVRRALLAYTPVHGLDIYQAQIPSWGAPGDWHSNQERWAAGGPAWSAPETEPSGGIESQAEIHPPQPGQGAMPGTHLPLLRLVGQIASTYLVAEGPDGLYLIDQHAAHERVLFEQMMRRSGEKIHAQTLLQPVPVTLAPAAARLLVPQLAALEEIGFQVEPFGPNTFLVRAIPALIAGADPAAALSVVVEDFEEDETPLQAEVEAKIIARVCKRAAVKAGQTLSPDEQRSLLAGLEACESPRTCPHGRPTMVHLSVDLLERQFGRRGAR